MREFVVAGSNAPEVFEATEAAFDDVSSFVGFLVVANFFLAIGLAWNDSSYALLFEESSDRIGVIAFIGEKLFDAGNHADALLGHDTIRSVAGREYESPRPTRLVDYRMYFAVVSALGKADRLIISPPFPPLAQRWTFT